jgi:endonuclease/exonuclease/phosphatase family metal-dependent hydrolase
MFPLRAVSYNVHFGKHVERLASAIEGPLARPDVLLLQEMQDHPREGQSRAARLAERLGYQVVYAPAVDKGGYTHGLAVLSRHRILSHQVLRLPPFRVLGTFEPRIALHVALELGAQQLHIYDVHLDVVLSVPQRLEQLGPVLDNISSCTGPVLVGGDFNTYLSQPSALDKGLEQAGLQPLARAVTRTHRFLPARLDGFFARGLLAGPAIAHLGVSASDHAPLEVSVQRLQGVSTPAA